MSKTSRADMAGPILVALGAVLTVTMSGHAQSSAQPSDPGHADQLVQELRQFPASLPATARSDGSRDPTEDKRRRVYDELQALGTGSLPALVRGLADPDVKVRRNVALFLNVVAGNLYGLSQSRLDIRPSLPALIAALRDPDARVREMAAQAIGGIGPDASSAVPEGPVVSSRPPPARLASRWPTTYLISFGAPFFRRVFPLTTQRLAQSR